MRRSIFILALCSLFLVPLMAQEAFYIYRNDGDFNGFFYDEVIEMRYSKLDFDSIEHDNYIMYEVQLADTLYRIPLASIDSIGFQQPEIILNPQLRHMDLLGMTPYVTARDSQTLTFSKELPDSLMPQIDNVLVGFTGILEEGGFGGRVTSINNTAEGIIVQTTELTKLSDVFVQFITIEEVGYDEEGQQVAQRTAGINNIRKASGGANLTIVSISTNMHLPLPLDNDNISITVDAGISLMAKLVMTYQITDEVFFIKSNTSQEFAFDSGITFKVHGDNSAPYELPLAPPTLSSIKFPAALPLFEIKPFPALGVRWGGEINAKTHFPTIGGKLVQCFTIDSDAPYAMTFTSNYYNTTPAMSNILDVADNTDVELTFEGFVQCGLNFDYGISTNSWFSKIASAGMGVEIWIGPKVDASLNINSKSFIYGDGPYTLAGSHVGMSLLSLDLDAYAKTYNFFMDKEYKYTWGDASLNLLPRWEMYMFPKFSEFEAKYNDEQETINASWKTDQRSVFWPSKAGIVVYDDFPDLKIFASDYGQPLSFGSLSPEKFQLNLNTKSMSAGTYRVAPSLMAFGGEYPVYSMAKNVTVPLKAKLDTNKVVLPAKGGSKTVHVETNGVVKQPKSKEENVKVGLVNENTVSISVADTNNLLFANKLFKDETVTILIEAEGDTTQGSILYVNVEQENDPHLCKHIYITGGNWVNFEDPTVGVENIVPCELTETESSWIITEVYTGIHNVPFFGGLLGNHLFEGLYTFHVPDESILLGNVVEERINWGFTVTINKATKHTTITGHCNITNVCNLNDVHYNSTQNTSFSFEGICGDEGNVIITDGSGSTNAYGDMGWLYGEDLKPGSVSNSTSSSFDNISVMLLAY